jgi:AcrR family transcriptional regulator
VSIKEIQEASGLPRGSIYHSFNNKEEIFSHMVNVYLLDNFQYWKELVKKSSDTFMKRIENSFHLLDDFNEKGYFPHTFMLEDENKKYFQMFFSTVYKPTKCKLILHKLYEESFKFYRELVEEAIENKEINEKTDVEALAMTIHTILKGYLNLWVFHKDFSTEKYMKANLKTIEEMIKK